MLSTILFSIVERGLARNQVLCIAEHCDIADNIQQCGYKNIVQCCFQKPRTGCSFFTVYETFLRETLFPINVLSCFPMWAN